MSENVKHKTSIGGQALIEGIMMRGPKGNAMSVRMPDGMIDTELEQYKPLKEKYKILGVPIIRGVAGFVESMVTGYKYLMKSADKSMTEEEIEEDMTKLDKWLNDHLGEKMMAVVGVISLVFGVALAFLIFMYLPTLGVDLFDDYVLKNTDISKFHPLLEGVLRIIIFVLYMLLVSQTKSIKRVFMYHGAEHKTIFCYENGLELTVENVRKMSRFHPRCGTSFMFVMLIISIFFSSALVLIFPNLASVNRILWILIKLAVLPLVMGLGYEFIKFAGRHDNLLVKVLSYPGILMQRITTKEPTDDIIEVGIESLKAVITDNPEDDMIK
ncbi:MAG: DUF1385 domain-containing protein [Oscillospiraceae bacterium]|nr:DUF1385 domain-containing protein [Oscillospiraceae bacterium]